MSTDVDMITYFNQNGVQLPTFEINMQQPLVMCIVPFEHRAETPKDIILKCNKYIVKVNGFLENEWFKLFKIESYIDNMQIQMEYKNQKCNLLCSPFPNPFVYSDIPQCLPGMVSPTMLTTSIVIDFPLDLDMKGIYKKNCSRKSIISGNLNLIIKNPTNGKCLAHLKFNVYSNIFNLYSKKSKKFNIK